eukprot:265182-Alexandrium_andersonii.AAC.1
MASAEANPKAKRSRYQGDVDRLVAALRPFVTKPNWIAYGTKMDVSPIKADLILPHGEMLQALRNIQDNLSFKPGHMTTAMQESEFS